MTDARKALADKIERGYSLGIIGRDWPTVEDTFSDEEKSLIVAALRSPLLGTREEVARAPDYDAAALALGFQRLPNGKWFIPNPGVHHNTASTFDTAEEIFDWWGRANGGSTALPPAPMPERDWPETTITNPDIADPTGVPYIDGLIHRLLDAQQDIKLEANESMSQSLSDASALCDEIETALRTAAGQKPMPERDGMREALVLARKEIERQLHKCGADEQAAQYFEGLLFQIDAALAPHDKTEG